MSQPFIQGISIEKYYQSQLLPPVFRLNGVVDVIRCKNIKDLSHPLYGKMKILEIPSEISMDIDTELDLKICEAMMNSQN